MRPASSIKRTAATPTVTAKQRSRASLFEEKRQILKKKLAPRMRALATALCDTYAANEIAATWNRTILSPSPSLTYHIEQCLHYVLLSDIRLEVFVGDENTAKSPDTGGMSSIAETQTARERCMTLARCDDDNEQLPDKPPTLITLFEEYRDPEYDSFRVRTSVTHRAGMQHATKRRKTRQKRSTVPVYEKKSSTDTISTPPPPPPFVYRHVSERHRKLRERALNHHQVLGEAACEADRISYKRTACIDEWAINVDDMPSSVRDAIVNLLSIPHMFARCDTMQQGRVGSYLTQFLFDDVLDEALTESRFRTVMAHAITMPILYAHFKAKAGQSAVMAIHLAVQHLLCTLSAEFPGDMQTHPPEPPKPTGELLLDRERMSIYKVIRRRYNAMRTLDEMMHVLRNSRMLTRLVLDHRTAALEALDRNLLVDHTPVQAYDLFRATVLGLYDIQRRRLELQHDNNGSSSSSNTEDDPHYITDKQYTHFLAITGPYNIHSDEESSSDEREGSGVVAIA